MQIKMDYQFRLRLQFLALVSALHSGEKLALGASNTKT
jgi:hypothetical protein